MASATPSNTQGGASHIPRATPESGRTTDSAVAVPPPCALDGAADEDGDAGMKSRAL
jgi:hypothetical protein